MFTVSNPPSPPESLVTPHHVNVCLLRISSSFFVFIAFNLVFNWRFLCLFCHLNFLSTLSTKMIPPVWQMRKTRLREMSDFPVFTYLVPDSSLAASLPDFVDSWESGHRIFLNGSTDPQRWVPYFPGQTLDSSEYAEHSHKTKLSGLTTLFSPFYLWNKWPLEWVPCTSDTQPV